MNFWNLFHETSNEDSSLNRFSHGSIETLMKNGVDGVKKDLKDLEKAQQDLKAALKTESDKESDK